MQNTQMSDWFVAPVQQEAPQEAASASNAGCGRGKSMVQPSWMTATGLAGASPGGGAEPPRIPPHIPAASGMACNGTASDRGTGGGYPVADDGPPEASPWEAMSSSHSTAPRNVAAAPRSGVSACSSDSPWGDLPGARPLFGVEVEVPRGFQRPGPGPWLECQPGDIAFVERVKGKQAFAAIGKREGWIDVEALESPHNTFPEFQVQIPVLAEPLKRLGLAFISVPGPIRGLAIAIVLPNSMAHDYNEAMQATFPRSQLLEGDVITWACGETEPEAMKRVLHTWREQRPALRLRVNRVGLCRTAPCGSAAAQLAGLPGVVPPILSYSEGQGLVPSPPSSPPPASTPSGGAVMAGGPATLSSFQ